MTDEGQATAVDDEAPQRPTPPRRWFRRYDSDGEFTKTTLPGWISAVTGIAALVAGVVIGYVQIRDARTPAEPAARPSNPAVTTDPSQWISEGDDVFSMMAPPEWIDERSYPIREEFEPGTGTGLAYSISTNVEAQGQTFAGVSGAFLLASRDIVLIADVSDAETAPDDLGEWLAETYRWAVDCDPDVIVSTYDNERYRGALREWTGCGETRATFFEAALAARDLSHVLYAQVTPSVEDGGQLTEQLLDSVHVDTSTIPDPRNPGSDILP